jgi:signal transduction histidine kinase
MFLWWGPELIQFYNDGYLPSFGHGKHPAAMGQRGADCWQEVWPIIHPQIVDVMERGKASWNENQLVPIYRNNRIEEVYWTYGYSPVLDETGGVGGVLVVCTETTPGVLAIRRLSSIRKLARITASCLAEAELDIPYSVVSVEGATALLTGLSGPEIPALSEPESATTLARRRLARGIACAPWPELVTEAVVHPIEGMPGGTLTLGLSPRLPFDESYRTFLLQIADQIANVTPQVMARSALERSHEERSRLLDAARVASRAKDEFLAMLGHELRNPLAPILTALEIMKVKNVSGLEREREIIERQASHLISLVDDLLDVSRVVEGKIELKKRRVALAEVVAAAIEMASPLFEKRRHDLHIEVPARGLDVDADPTRLAQIVANLLTNAARYTEPGGKVSLHARRDDQEIVLRVEDTGMGIAAEQIPHLFERFFQGSRRSDQAQGGLGLGLALVKSLIELHGGSVHAKSAGPGKGSTFELRLALASGEAEAEKFVAEERVPIDVSKAERVLLIDDNEDITDLFSTFLELSGFDVQTAHDGPSALRVAAAYKPTVAVLDLGLPVMDGYELAAKLVEQLGTSAPRLIAMSGYGRKDDLERTRRAGFESHLVKPVDATSLLRAIAQR